MDNNIPNARTYSYNSHQINRSTKSTLEISIIEATFNKPFNYFISLQLDENNERVSIFNNYYLFN